MEKLNSKYIIIGAGLSGLTTAYHLAQQGEKDFIILEGRNQIGGRIHTKDGIDLGATWFQGYHEKLSELLLSLGLNKFPQYSKGKSVLVYNSMAPAHYFETDPNSPSAHRIANGSVTLIHKLAEKFKDKIHLYSNVIGIYEHEDQLAIRTENEILFSEKAVITIPPKIATGINFDPAIPGNLEKIMLNTHTWMSNAIKVGITFDHPFWREKDFSGTVIGQIGPIIELYDHSNISETTFSLMGFVNEGLRDETPENRKERILSYLEKYLGSEIRDYNNYYEKDWSKDPHTSSNNLKSVYMSPNYGNPIFNDFFMNNKLLFSGAETSPVYGGYMEGAIYSGIKAACKLLDL